MPRYFTRDEAEALLAELRPLLQELQREKLVFDELQRGAEAIEARLKGNGHRDGAARLADQREALRVAGARVAEAVGRIEALGAVVKDVERGLVDFLALRDGEEIYLCWCLGEPRIEWWHTLDGGFAARKPL